MKVIEQPQTIERHGVVNKIQCRIAANSHSFKILARQYSNPIRAILQEIGANAVDAQARVGKRDKPFVVKLPNEMDPHLRIRDFGCSMTPEVIKNVYAEYMASDKRNTNDEHGYFGIGSKTPLTYTDSFNITTYFNGMMRMYTMCYDENGIPEINQFSEYPTDEPDGVEISFAVKKDDFDKFYSEARNVYSFFDPRPMIKGYTDFQFHKFNKILEGDNWYLVNQYREPKVIIGNIAYPIERYSIRGLSSEANSLLTNSIHFEMPIGSVNMTPSRESLEYNEYTCKNIAERLEVIVKEVQEQILQLLKDAHSDWNKGILFRKLSTNIHNLYIPNMDNLRTVCVNGIMASYQPNGNKAKKRVAQYNNTAVGHNVSRHSNTVLVIKDIDKKFDKRCRFYCVENEKTIYLIDNNIHPTKKSLMDSVGAIDKDNAVFLASELPDPPKTNNGARKPKKTTKTVYEYCSNGNSSTYSTIWDGRYWEEVEVDHKKGTYVYVILNRFKAVDINIHLAYKLCQRLGIKVPTIIGLNGNNKDLSTRKNFVSLRKYISDKLASIVNNNVLNKCIKHKTYHSIRMNGKFKQIAINSTEKVVDKTCPLYIIVEFMKEFESKKIDYFISAIEELSEIARYNLKVEEVDNEVTTAVQDLFLAFPMLKDYLSCSWNFSRSESNHIISAVNTIWEKRNG